MKANRTPTARRALKTALLNFCLLTKPNRSGCVVNLFIRSETRLVNLTFRGVTQIIRRAEVALIKEKLTMIMVMRFFMRYE